MVMSIFVYVPSTVLIHANCGGDKKMFEPKEILGAKEYNKREGTAKSLLHNEHCNTKLFTGDKLGTLPCKADVVE